MPKGFKLTEETKRKMSEAHKGKVFTEEHKHNLSLSKMGSKNPMYGKKMSEEQKSIRKEKSTGKKHSEETKRRLSEERMGEGNPMYGKNMSDSAKSKLREANIGEKNPFYGRKHSEKSLREMSEKRKGKTAGEKHHNWKNGISFEPYDSEFTKALKQKIRVRDNYTCQWCGKSGKHVHHIDGNKKNSKPWNLITLCNGCNSKEQFQREEIMPYFYSINKDQCPELQVAVHD